MGYTHYWRRPRAAPKGRFGRWRDDVRWLLMSPHHTIDIQGPDGYGYLVLRDTHVSFKGDAAGGHDCEDFTIERVFEPAPHDEPEHGRYFEFCKTQREPYDLLVCAALIRLHVHFPVWPIWSDGSSAEWWDAVKLCEKVFGGETKLPPEIKVNPCQRCKSTLTFATHAGIQHPGGKWVELCDECWEALPVEEV